MHRLSKAGALGLLTGIVGHIVSFVPWGIDLEENVGLHFLFKMRGPRRAPGPTALCSPAACTARAAAGQVTSRRQGTHAAQAWR